MIRFKSKPILEMACLLIAIAVVLPGCSRSNPPPVVLIVIDTLRTDTLGCFGADKSATPSIDKLAAESVLFENAYSPSPWTLPSFASLLTATYPTENGAGKRQADQKFYPFNERLITAAESFKSHGYSTAAIMNNIFLRGEFGFKRGFDEYNFNNATVHKIRKAEEVTNTSIRWLRKQLRSDEPYFMLVHYFDPHFHYMPPPNFRKQFGCELSEQVLSISHPDEIRNGKLPLNEWDRLNLENLYRAEVAYTDQEIARLLAFMRDNGVLDKALVVITADHGEEFWDHGDFEHGHTQYEELVKVPLLFRFPDKMDAGRRIDKPVRLMDVMPTVHDWLKLPPPSTYRGESFLGQVQGSGASGSGYSGPLFFEACMYGGEKKALQANRLKLILDMDTDTTQLFDLRADPKEQKDLSTERTEETAKLKEALLKISNDLQKSADQDKKALNLPNQIMDDLEGLGYVK